MYSHSDGIEGYNSVIHADSEAIQSSTRVEGGSEHRDKEVLNSCKLWSLVGVTRICEEQWRERSTTERWQLI